ncbi:carboxymuconolactone decarboxylase family protein [Streptomyces liliifuscus]|uniref:Carboxymuconolactone decarboxylase family protein n=1 Tax=Streptomyces liliifuscus TaxID=2797636 RepID=A0A7T7RH56_9ACTN|nr:carboxymuconolactone decarboxylase family protein [Streptomyces liliifuscus]
MPGPALRPTSSGLTSVRRARRKRPSSVPLFLSCCSRATPLSVTAARRGAVRRRDELVEALTHVAFYAGWPSEMGALTQLKAIIEEAE